MAEVVFAEPDLPAEIVDGKRLVQVTAQIQNRLLDHFGLAAGQCAGCSGGGPVAVQIDKQQADQFFYGFFIKRRLLFHFADDLFIPAGDGGVFDLLLDFEIRRKRDLRQQGRIGDQAVIQAVPARLGGRIMQCARGDDRQLSRQHNLCAGVGNQPGRAGNAVQQFDSLVPVCVHGGVNGGKAVQMKNDRKRRVGMRQGFIR